MKFKHSIVLIAALIALGAMIGYGSGPIAQAQGTGTVVADLGFRPDAHGLPFENYGAGNYTNLTPVEMRRIFGDAVCGALDGDTCTLTPPAQEWMTRQNTSMDGGHCYGFSVFALRMFTKQITPADFGVSSVADLKIEGNEKLQREIAYSFVYQYFDPVRASAWAGAPNAVLDKLTELLKSGANGDSFTIGFFNAQGGGGHAVTPYAVEDRGNGTVAVQVWDNNFPKTARAILFDRNANAWSYVASINPNEPASEYKGDAQTQSLFLFPTNPGSSKQACPFCQGSGTSRLANGLAAPTDRFNQIFLDGDPSNHAHLLIKDEQGKRYGYLSDGKFVTEIPGVKHIIPFTGDLWKDSEEPEYYVPVGMKFTLTIDGSLLKKSDTADVVMIGPGYDVGIEGIALAPGQKDTVTFAPDGTTLSYKTAGSESPDITVGIETKGADWAFTVKGFKMDGGGTINVALNNAKGQLSVNVAGTKGPGTYGLYADRIEGKGAQSFGHDNITLAPGDTAYLNFGQWQGGKSAMALDLDKGSDGTIDETVQLSDDK